MAIDALALEDAHGRADQRVRGVDALDEVQIQGLLAAAFAGGGRDGDRGHGCRHDGREPWGVLREVPYPSDAGVKRSNGRRSGGLPRRSERRRCDLVLLPTAGARLADPAIESAAVRAGAGTLFEDQAGAMAATIGRADRLVAAEDACWLEVKVVGQHCFRDGVPGPNSSYSGELTAALTDDVSKLASDPAVRQAAMVLVLFTSDDRTAEHDVAIALHRVLDRGVLFRAPVAVRTPIVDRIGNSVCSLIAVPVADRGPEPVGGQTAWESADGGLSAGGGSSSGIGATSRRAVAAAAASAASSTPVE